MRRLAPVDFVDGPVVAHAKAELAAMAGAGQRVMAHHFGILRHASQCAAHLLGYPCVQPG